MKEKQPVYFSRELSWVEFNARVLDEALQKDVPLLERLRFLTIVSSNFDEFFMVRVASLKAQCLQNGDARDVAGLTAREQLERISARVQELVKIQYRCLLDDILPGLAKEGLEYIPSAAYLESHVRYLEAFFMNDVFPLLTPLRTSPAGELPSIGNLRLHAAFLLKNNITVPGGPLSSFLEDAGVLGGSSAENEEGVPPIAIVQIPASLPRIVWLPAEGSHRCFTLLDDVVQTFGTRLFPGFSVEETLLFKIARDADFAVDEERDDDFIAAIQEVLVSRQSSVPVRLISSGFSPTILSFLRDSMKLEQSDLYQLNGPIDLSTMAELANADGFDRLRNPVWKNFWPVDVPRDAPLWDELKRTDILLHVPYQAWDPVARFISDAAEDPSVLAIKMTLYRTSGNSPVIKALEQAARSGKHVTVFVELKARFDEERNISWAHRLEECGVIVVHGIARLKVHAKMCLIVRKEQEGIKRYVHLSTGNYNDRTARLYVDMSIMTSNLEIANDAALFFNMISGYSAILGTRQLVMAPVEMKSRLISLIEREITRSVPEKPGMIVAKMNSLADPEIIQALYRASTAGVRVLLNVRGICMLVPGIKDMSENITVVSIVDRYLEHTRIVWFANGGSDELFLSSADWMPRNLDRRVELMFPVLQESIRNTIRDILFLYFTDNVKAHYLQSDGSWIRRKPTEGEKRVRVQECLYESEKKRTEMFEKEPQREFIVRRS
ncbi:MAG TPA: polyphosphate kinase 1 [Treponemataceae bacterium]|nr:polyphosphate kinase 1 [Treponemataceae bacterium]